MLGVCHMQPPDLLTFEDMIACVVTKNIGRTPNRHWEPAYEYCDICSIDYDYISKSLLFDYDCGICSINYDYNIAMTY